MPGPRSNVSACKGSARTGRSRGQALIETALVIPVLLMLAFGVVGVGRVTQAQLAVSAAVREAARFGALADDAAQAQEQGRSQGEKVAQGYGLTGDSFTITVDAGSFERGGKVRAAAHYEVALDDLPILSWATVPVASEHVERIDLYRSRWKARSQP